MPVCCCWRISAGWTPQALNLQSQFVPTPLLAVGDAFRKTFQKVLFLALFRISEWVPRAPPPGLQKAPGPDSNECVACISSRAVARREPQRRLRGPHGADPPRAHRGGGGHGGAWRLGPCASPIGQERSENVRGLWVGRSLGQAMGFFSLCICKRLG